MTFIKILVTGIIAIMLFTIGYFTGKFRNCYCYIDEDEYDDFEEDGFYED